MPRSSHPIFTQQHVCHWVHRCLATAIITLGLTLLSPLTHAETPSAEKPWYQVELYVFRQPVAPSTELWPPKDDVSFFSDTAFLTIDPVPMANALIAYQQLPGEWVHSSTVRSTLRKSGRYQLLYEAAWRQPIVDSKDAKTIYLSGGKRQANYSELEGTLRLHKSRYLHVDAHLILGRYEEQRVPINTMESLPLGSADRATPTRSRFKLLEGAPSAQPAEANIDEPSEYRVVPVEIFELKQSRRMRSGELHYMDHPKLGLLIQVHRVKS